MDLTEVFFQLYVLDVVLFFLLNLPSLFFLMTLTCHCSYSTILEIMYHNSSQSVFLPYGLVESCRIYLTIQAGTAIVPSWGWSSQGVFFVHSCPRTRSWTTVRVRGNCKQLQVQLATNAEVVARVVFLSPKGQKVQQGHLHLSWSPLSLGESSTGERVRHFHCMIHLTKCRCLVQNEQNFVIEMPISLWGLKRKPHSDVEIYICSDESHAECLLWQNTEGYFHPDLLQNFIWAVADAWIFCRRKK